VVVGSCRIMRAALFLGVLPSLVVAKQRLIVDTDMGLDIDDVAAVCIANALHKAGEAELLAVVHDTGFAKGVGGISAINHWYGHDDIPIGAFKGTFGRDECRGCGGGNGQDQFLSDLVSTYSPPVEHYDQVSDAVEVYRSVLAAQPDKSVNIASIGMATNLKALVQSEGDKHSSLSGKDLIAQKVNQIVYMDGGYNFGCGSGMLGDAEECWSSARDAVYGMPYTDITQLFSTLAGDVVSGKRMMDASLCPNAQGSPCKRAFTDWAGPDGQGPGGRSSWDPFVVLVAVRGLEGAHATSHNVNVYVEENGDETYPDSSNPHQQKVDYACCNVQGDIEKDIDDLLCAAHDTAASVIV